MARIYSFGFRHGLCVGDSKTFQATTNRMVPTIQEADGCLVIDVRGILPKNPYHNRKLRGLRGDDVDVIRELEKTSGIHISYHRLRTHIEGWLRGVSDGDIYVGCTGGHHRSVYIANRLGKDLGFDVLHLNYHDK